MKLGQVLIASAFLAAALSGCSTKEMKSTPFYEGTQVRYKGDPKDRLNLWPVAYWHNPVGSVAWPLFSFSDDLFAVRPLYSQYRQNGAEGPYDEFNFLWPLCQADTKRKDYRIFPFFWGEHDAKTHEGYQAVFPLYWNSPSRNVLYPLWIYRNRKDSWWFSTIGGLAGAGKKKSGYRSSWCFPFWYENNEGVLATTLFGYSPDSFWVFPLWYHDKDKVVSLFYSQGARRLENDAESSWWASPLALSWGSRYVHGRHSDSEGMILLGLSGWDNTTYSDGQRCDQWWCWPFCGRETRVDPEGNSRTTDTWLASGLAGWQGGADGVTESRVLPLYTWRKDSWFMTILGGWDEDSVYLTPLAGFSREKNTCEGGWIFPVWHHKKHRDFDESLAKFDGPELPDVIKIKSDVETNDLGEVLATWWSIGEECSKRDQTTWFLLSDNDRSLHVWGWDYISSRSDRKPTVEVERRHKIGNRLLLNYRSEWTTAYDARTRERISDVEETEGSFLVWLYQYESSHDRMKGATHARHRVLWKLWDWEEIDGDVSLDIFPGFTYDSKKDGSVKTSLLWRLFRYERNAAGDAAIDFLFLPVWR